MDRSGYLGYTALKKKSEGLTAQKEDLYEGDSQPRF